MAIWVKIELWAKRVIVVAATIAAVSFLLVLAMTIFSWYGAEPRVDIATVETKCEQHRTGGLLENLKSTVEGHDSACFLRVLREVEGSSIDRGMRASVDAYLAQQLSEPNGRPSLFKNDYVRLVALNIIIPAALRGDVSFNVKDAQTYLRKKSEDKNTEVRNQALVVLSYYRDDTDTAIFRKHAVAESDNDVSHSMWALAENCSPKAKEALAWALSQERVKRYMQKYRGKERITEYTTQRCPVVH